MRSSRCAHRRDTLSPRQGRMTSQYGSVKFTQASSAALIVLGVTPSLSSLSRPQGVGLFCTALTRTAQCIIASMVLFCTACPRTAAMPVPVRNRTKGAIPHWAQCACPTITKTFIHPFLPEFVSKILLVLSLTCPKIL